MQLHEWIRAARTHAKLTQEQLGELVGRTKANVGHWETGKHAPSYEMLKQIASKTGYPMIGEQPNVEAAGGLHGPYPVVSFVQAGAFSEAVDSFQPGDADEWQYSTRSLGKHGYLLRVKGESMHAPGHAVSFAEGMLLHVNPDLEPQPGNYVIVRRENENAATFKKLVYIDGYPYLEAINPTWPQERKYIRMREGDSFCGVVVDASLGSLL